MSTSTHAQLSDGAISTATVFLSFSLALLIVYFIHEWYTWRQLSHVPGPFWAAFTKLWMVRQSLKRRQPYAFKEANERYGKIGREIRSLTG